MPSVTLDPIPSWRPGHLIRPGGRTKLVAIAGVGSKTGDAEFAFRGLMRFLTQHGGYHAEHDLLEGTYAGAEAAGRWQPRPYTAADTRKPILESAVAIAGVLEWYRAALPPETRFCVLGYSLGGVVGLDGATLTVARDRAGWRDRLPALITLASPVRGCNAGPFIHWAWLVTPDPDPLGALAHDLDQRWLDPDEQTRVQRRAAFLRGEGTRVLTLADPGDAVVRPDEALVPAPGETPDSLLVPTPLTRPGSLGHGPILDEPAIWRRILALIGPQSALPSAPGAPPPGPTIEDELEAIKARLRAQGRL